MSRILVAGVDEAGRGPLAGPVVTAAVILDDNEPIEGLADSKKISAAKRRLLEQEIKHKALAWSVAQCSVEEIDELNILHATMLAMKRAVESLSISPSRVLVDGNRCPDIAIASEAVKMLLQLHERYPQYGFDRHKGYPTKLHIEMLRLHGVTPHHRRSYRPVQIVIEQGKGRPDR